MKERYNSNKLNLALILLCWGTILFCLILKLFGSRQFEIPPYTIELQSYAKFAKAFLEDKDATDKAFNIITLL